MFENSSYKLDAHIASILCVFRSYANLAQVRLY